MGTTRVVVVACSLVGCVAISGVGDLSIEREGADGGGIGVDAVAPQSDAATDATVQALVEAGPPAAGPSVITLSGTGVAIGAIAVAILTTKDADGQRVTHGGGRVVFSAAGGTSVLDVGDAVDVGDGTYRAMLTGVKEGTKVAINATFDGVAVTTPPPQIRVVNPVQAGLTLSLDAATARAGKPCDGSAVTWADGTSNHFDGALTAFPATPCTPTSGWNGDGSPENPYRLTFDGADDAVAFGAVNSLVKQTIVAFVRQSGDGTANETGTGGIPAIFPIIAKGAAEAETEAIDEGYFFGITPARHFGIDFEQSNAPISGNNPLTGNATLADNQWVMLAFAFDPAQSARTMYVNAAVDGTSATANVPALGPSARLVVGGADKSAGDPAGRFKGDIAIVQTFDRALTASEIAQTCDAYSSRFGLVSCLGAVE